MWCLPQAKLLFNFLVNLFTHTLTLTLSCVSVNVREKFSSLAHR